MCTCSVHTIWVSVPVSTVAVSASAWPLSGRTGTTRPAGSRLPAVHAPAASTTVSARQRPAPVGNPQTPPPAMPPGDVERLDRAVLEQLCAARQHGAAQRRYHQPRVDLMVVRTEQPGG